MAARLLTASYTIDLPAAWTNECWIAGILDGIVRHQSATCSRAIRDIAAHGKCALRRGPFSEPQSTYPFALLFDSDNGLSADVYTKQTKHRRQVSWLLLANSGLNEISADPVQRS